MGIWLKEVIWNLNLLFNITLWISLIVQILIIKETNPKELESNRKLFHIMFHLFWLSLIMVIFLPSEKAMNHML